jgi:dolichol-phosphate mannosyltransferase
MSKKIVSLIIPSYNEEENISYCYQEISKFWKKNIKDYNYELVFVDDGSYDNSILEIEKIIAKDKKVKLLEFAKNFGKEIAVTAGINHCQGDSCIVVDADLQYPIETIPEFIKKWEEGFEVVIGVRDKKQTSNFIEKTGSSLFYKIMETVSETRVIPGALDFRLIDRTVIQEFNRFTERNRITRALIDWIGFKQSFVFYKEKSRQHGTASYSFFKRLNLALHAFVSHSMIPLKLAGYLGIFITTTSGLTGLFSLFNQFVINKDQYNLTFSGPFLLGLLNLFLIGIVLICLGLISLYIGSIHIEVTNRPLYILRNKTGFTENKSKK